MIGLNLVLGLEVHLHLKTKTKMFCGCNADIYKSEPNTHTCPVCLGLPGALPVPNYDAVKLTQLLGLALGCLINKDSRFDRKHYFYPDLPKGFQISQYKQPLCIGGSLTLDSGKKIAIERIHLEEDTAKSFHENQLTLIDFNKSGMPLVEIVTDPVFDDVIDAVEFCKKIQELVKTLDISDADMEKGQMRLEANISLRTSEMQAQNYLPDYKVEIKNINSFRFMEKAVKSEILRQSEIIHSGEKVIQENRGFDEDTGKTISQRDKEEAHDYRYFPEPDIPPMQFSEIHIEELRKSIPELPHQKINKYTKLGLSVQEARFLASAENKVFAEKFDKVLISNDFKLADISSKKVASILVNKPETVKLTIPELLDFIKGPTDVISDDESLEMLAKEVISKNPRAKKDYKDGKSGSVEFILGQIMRETKGKADPNKARNIISKLLSM